MADPAIKRYEFEGWQLDPIERQLTRQGEPIPLTPKVFDTLLILVEKAGRLVSKEEFMSRVWPDAFVEDAVLTQNISQLRKVLGAEVIETVSKKGYRFLKPVHAITTATPTKSQEKLAPDRVISSRAASKRAWLQAACILLAASIVALGLVYLGNRKRHASEPHAILSLAVLPLENLSGDPNQEYFVDGMTDELITDLAQIHSLRVISRTSVVQFKHSRKKLPEIASELNVDAVVEGSVLRTGDDVRVTAQLLDAREDRHLWAASYEQEMENVLRLQAQIARTIAEQVNARLTREEGTKLAARPSTNPESYDALLTGRYLFNRRNPADTKKAIGYLRRAVEVDPQNARAWATLAYCYSSLGADLGVSDPAEVLPLAHLRSTRRFKSTLILPKRI